MYNNLFLPPTCLDVESLPDLPSVKRCNTTMALFPIPSAFYPELIRHHRPKSQSKPKIIIKRTRMAIQLPTFMAGSYLSPRSYQQTR
jgi:hypothetical protein